MTRGAFSRRLLATRLGLAGGVLGVLAGIVQATVGTRIPEWTGAKLEPGVLGLLTVALSLLAALAAAHQSRPGLAVGVRAACAVGLITCGLLCFTTVGPLWYLPGPLLLCAGALTVDRWADTAALLPRNWMRFLLSVLGTSELVMAAGGTPLLTGVGAVGGTALIAAAWLRPAHRLTLAALVAIGTVPLAVLAWTGIVPVLLLLAAAGVATPLIRSLPGTGRVPA